MSTFREIVYMVLDRCKLSGDDSYIEPEHVLFMVSKLRAYIIASKYRQRKEQVSASNAQSITVDMEPSDSGCGCVSSPDGMYYARSVTEIPAMLAPSGYGAGVFVAPADGFPCVLPVSVVSPTRFATAGYSKWQRGGAFATIGPDNRLWLKSTNPSVQDIGSVMFTAVFEDAEKAAQAEANSSGRCGSGNSACDVMDMRFPMEEGLVALLIDHAVQAVSQAESTPKDNRNSSSDELDSVVAYLNTLLKERYRRNNGADEIQG